MFSQQETEDWGKFEKASGSVFLIKDCPFQRKFKDKCFNTTIEGPILRMFVFVLRVLTY